jgi:hypothetical protein
MKEDEHRTSTDEGMQIDLSKEQYPHAFSSIRLNLEFASKAILSSEVHEQNEQEHKISTDDGIHRDLSDEQFLHAYGSNRISCEFGSNARCCSEQSALKQR